MAAGGKGLARYEGMVLFVADALVGDQVRVKVISQSKRYAEAEVVEFLKPSQERIKEPCSHVSECGGCCWQAATYENQLSWKHQFLKSALSRIAKVDDALAIGIVPSPKMYGYRNRVHLKGRVAADGSIRLGYFRRKSNDLVAITECKISDLQITDFFEFIKDIRLNVSREFKFKVEIQVYLEGVSIVFFPDHHDEEQQKMLRSLCAELSRWEKLVWVGFVSDVRRDLFLAWDHDKFGTWFARPAAFSQVNIEANALLRKRVFELVDPDAKRVLDVCCGNGNFSIPLRKPGRYIEGVELSFHSIDCAQYNVLKNPIPDTENPNYLVGDATRHLWKCARGGESFDTVILDPPRAGLYEGMIPLAKIKPKQIIYISCDPATLARDVGSLCKQGYKIVFAEAYDFFPQSFHVESLLVLRID